MKFVLSSPLSSSPSMGLCTTYWRLPLNFYFLFIYLFCFVLFWFCFVFVLFLFYFCFCFQISCLFTFILAILYLSIELYIDNFAHHILSCYMMSPTLISSGGFFHCSVSLLALNTVVDVVYAEVSSCLLWITKALWGFTLVTLSP